MGGHQANAPMGLTHSSSIVARDSMHTAFTITALNDFDVPVGEFQNACLNTPMANEGALSHNSRFVTPQKQLFPVTAMTRTKGGKNAHLVCPVSEVLIEHSVPTAPRGSFFLSIGTKRLV